MHGLSIFGAHPDRARRYDRGKDGALSFKEFEEAVLLPGLLWDCSPAFQGSLPKGAWAPSRKKTGRP